MVETTLPRLTSEDKVMKPYPLEAVTIVGMGRTAQEFVSHAYRTQFVPVPGKHEVWTINSGICVFKSNLVFNMHDLEQLPEPIDYIGLYKKMPETVVSIKAIEGVDNIKEFPFAEAIDKFQETYFANGISYMVVFALLCGVKSITIYGADYNYPNRTDYEAGRANLEYWLGYARALGVEVNIATTSTLCDTYYRLHGKGQIGYGSVYGFFETQPLIEQENGRLKLVGFQSRPSADALDRLEPKV